MPGRDLIACTAGALFVAALTPACGRNETSPAPIVTQSTIALMSPTPAPGSTLTPAGTPPGTFFTRGSGQFGVTVRITAGQDLPFAQLAVFLLTTTNSSGYSLPCEVTGIRAVFNTRDDLPLGGVPPANFIIADTTLPIVYHLRPGGS